MEYVVIYYFIGVIVSLYFIYYYRFSNKTKQGSSKNDSWLGLISAWIWPIQIIVHFRGKYLQSKQKN